jgi:PPOX class probable F420-dependent enzyme
MTELDARYSSPDAQPTEWPDACRQLAAAEIFWVTTVRADGRPHSTPLIAVWADDALYFCTGPDEQKAKNLSQNSHCILTTGCNTFGEGLDLVVEGEAVNVRDEARLVRLAAAFEAKYGVDWHFDVRDGAFQHGPGSALVYEVAPTTAYGFGKGEKSSHTRWRFASGA